MNGQERIDERRRRQAGRRGFTLIELLVVILIILIVSAVLFPLVLPALSHRQVSEAARLLQGGSLVGCPGFGPEKRYAPEWYSLASRIRRSTAVSQRPGW